MHICALFVFAAQAVDERPNITDIDIKLISDEYEITNYGPAVTQISTLSGYVVGSVHYIFSRNTIPGELLGYDVEKGKITTQVVVSLENDRSTAAHTMIHINNELFIPVRFENRRLSLIRLNLETGEYYEAANMNGARTARSMSISPDGKLFISTDAQFSARIFEFDPVLETGRWINSFQTQGRQDARSVIATDDYLYVGMGLEAPDIWQYDRKTEEKTSIFPNELRNIWLDVNTMVLHDNWIIAGGHGPVNEAVVVLINRRDPSEFRLVNHGGNLVQRMTLFEDMLFFGSGEGVWSYNIADDELNRVSDMRCNRGLYYQDGKLHGTDGRRNISIHDLETGHLTIIDLGKDAGAREWPEPGQSMIYSDGVVYVGGHHAVAIHNVMDGTYKVIQAGGEAKHMIRVPATNPGQSAYIFYGAYSIDGTLVQINPDIGEYKTISSAPPGDNRPRALAYDDTNGLVLMGSQSDRNGSGSLTIYDMDRSQTMFIRNPFGDHSVSAVASINGIAYLASAQGRVDPPTDARVAAWNPVTGEKLWEKIPVQDESRIRSLVAVGSNIMGLTPNGHFFVIEPETTEILYSKQIFSDTRYDPGRLVVRGDKVIAISDNEIRRINPVTYEDEVLISGLHSQWFHWPTATIDDDGNVYALKELDLIKIGKIN